MSESDREDLVTCLRDRADRIPDKEAFRFRKGRESEIIADSVTYGGLHARACCFGEQIAEVSRAADRVLLLYPPGLDFVAAFFGCLYAGRIAIPMSAPHPAQVQRALPRLRAIMDSARPALVLGVGGVEEAEHAGYADLIAGSQAGFVSLQRPDPSLPPPVWRPTEVAGHTPAFLQFTSGSTSSPKGVILTHANILANLRLIRDTLTGALTDVRGVFWLPPHHDMGLIGGILGNIYREGTTTLMSPIDFLKRPLSWLQAISADRANISGAPDFAYQMAVERTDPEERAALDLSSWEVAFSGAERIRIETLRRFADAFAVGGFRPQAFHASYGLAEATLLVSCGRVSIEDVPAAGPGYVTCGRPAPGAEVVIVDPAEPVALPDGAVGEVWVQGASVSAGYWNAPEASVVFAASLPGRAGTFLRTGDLGFLRDGELYVTGRLKELIIINGKNHHPEDIEATVARSHRSIRSGQCATFSVDLDQEERLVVVAEIDRAARAEASKGPGDDLSKEICFAVQRMVSEQHMLSVHEVVLIRRGALPRTTSGKIQRLLCRERYVSGSWAADAP